MTSNAAIYKTILQREIASLLACPAKKLMTLQIQVKHLLTPMLHHTAQAVYLVQVMPTKMKPNALQYCNLSQVRDWLGIKTGGTSALLLIALLAGGDYHQGAEKVGMRSAFLTVSYLLKGKEVS